MKRIALALLLAGVALPALAADNSVIVTPGAGVTMRSRDVGAGVESMITILGDTGGNPSGVFSNYGTTPGSVLVPGVNAFITNAPAVTQSGTWNIGTVTTITGPVPVTESGTWTVQPGNTANTTPWLFQGNVSNASDAVATGAISSPSITYNYGFNGTTWDRLRVDGSKNLNVNCAVGCSASSNIAQIAGVTLGATAVTNYGTTPAATAVPGVNAFVTNANANGQATMANSSPVVVASNQSAFPINVAAATTGGSAISAGNNIVANNTTAVVVKASAGTLYGVQLGGIGSVPVYLKIYNAASATCGTGTPIKRLIIPVNSTAANGAGSNITFGPQGAAFGTGITYCVTVGIADADTTAPAASSYLVNMDWQ